MVHQETLIGSSDYDSIRKFFDRFHCSRCGQCCEKGQGIFVDPDDIENLAIFLGTSKHKVKAYTVTCNGHRYLKSPCPFHDKECKVYKSRPKVCQLYPLAPYYKDGKEYVVINKNCPVGAYLCKTSS